MKTANPAHVSTKISVALRVPGSKNILKWMRDLFRKRRETDIVNPEHVLFLSNGRLDLLFKCPAVKGCPKANYFSCARTRTARVGQWSDDDYDVRDGTLYVHCG